MPRGAAKPLSRLQGRLREVSRISARRELREHGLVIWNPHGGGSKIGSGAPRGQLWKRFHGLQEAVSSGGIGRRTGAEEGKRGYEVGR